MERTDTHTEATRCAAQKLKKTQKARGTYFFMVFIETKQCGNIRHICLCPSKEQTAVIKNKLKKERPHGLTLTWWGCCGFNQPSLPTPFYSVLVSVSVFMALSNVFHSKTFSRHLSAFSLCSSGLISALLVLSTIYLFLKVSLSPDIILCDWLGLKHQLTN